MKRNLTFLLLAMALTLSCSKNDKNEGEQPNGKELSKSEIIGTWWLEAIIEDGRNAGIVKPANDCEKRTNIVFRENNTFTLKVYESIKYDCVNNIISSGMYSLSEKTLVVGPDDKRHFFIKDNKLIVKGAWDYIFVRK